MLYSLDNISADAPFPPVEHAETEPDGLLAVGGDLSPTRLLNAYSRGIFPWFSYDQPILWWSPDPRSILQPANIKISRSLRKTLRNKPYTVTFDKAFSQVMEYCSEPRSYTDETWITKEIKTAYTQLHELGYGHSVEVWCDQTLIGGLYGIAIGKAFFGESMFSHQTDASKIALVKLAQRLHKRGYGLIDCQVDSQHLTSLGAQTIERSSFCDLLAKLCNEPGEIGPWLE